MVGGSGHWLGTPTASDGPALRGAAPASCWCVGAGPANKWAVRDPYVPAEVFLVPWALEERLRAGVWARSPSVLHLPESEPPRRSPWARAAPRRHPWRVRGAVWGGWGGASAAHRGAPSASAPKVRLYRHDDDDEAREAAPGPGPGAGDTPGPGRTSGPKGRSGPSPAGMYRSSGGPLERLRPPARDVHLGAPQARGGGRAETRHSGSGRPAQPPADRGRRPLGRGHPGA